MKRIFLIAIIALPSVACNPHVTIDQTKPMEININITGHLDLVIHDAREDMEKITGEKPTNVVRPEDVGLPATSPSGTRAPVDPRALALDEYTLAARVTRVPNDQPQPFAQGSEDDLKKAMAGRNAQIQSLWNSQAVGESHTGLLVRKGTLTDEQQKLVDAENKDRQVLYAAEAKSKSASTGKTVTPEDVALAYYVARLGYAKPGAWFEKKKPNSNEWEWKQWGQ